MDSKNEPPAYTETDLAAQQPTDALHAGTFQDQQDMIRLGKVQEFRRNFDFLPILGFAAVLMSTWEGVLSSASYVIPNGGPTAIIWCFVISLFGFGAAIFSMAEMASWAPTSGYHWVSEFAAPKIQKILSYVVGWFCVLGWQAGTAGQCFGSASQIQGLIALNDPTYVPQRWHATCLSIGIVGIGCIFNTFLARRLPILQTCVLFLHIAGFFAILIPLWVLAPKNPSHEVWNEIQNNAGWPSDGLALLVGLTSSIGALIGPDAAVHMAEEVQDASRTIPKAMIWTLAMNGSAGLVMAITFAYCLGPLSIAIQQPYFFAFISTFFVATKSHAGATVMSLIITILTIVSAVDNVATASRQMFAFARDNGLPFSRFISHVRFDIPLNSVLITFTITSLLSLINLGSSVAYNAILSIGIVSVLTSYLISISCIFYRRFTSRHPQPARWSLGRFGAPLNALGIAYLIVVWLFAFFPLGTPVVPSTMNWASAVYGFVAIVASIYFLMFARRTYVSPVTRVIKEI